MNRFYIILFILAIFYGCNNPYNEKKQLLTNKIYKPGFGELMTAIQTHHEKLWFAGKNTNWKLADFEIHEIIENFEQIEDFQVVRNESKEIGMIYPFLNNLEKDIKNTDIKSFNKNYQKLTKSCNTCHELTHFAFIKIRIPEKNPFYNQIFNLND